MTVTDTPGQWPTVLRAQLPEPDEQGDQHLAYTAEQARFHVTLGSIRADLEAQPSQVCRHAAKRRWVNAIAAIADELDQQLRNTG
ncbi:hypothetical protein KZO11_10110 [Streptomyces anulatus]|uniref:hypothetical protein n=1 Tax=Streptomyces anulatus TaxID=1892 RepID=UPI001C5E3B19|nr:hypothetical protein [Streptomyces anulatus]QYA94038.1 hypothetical protein KZO11_10110 [Streptomyces anulatus]